jgi:hypothetical protein
LEKVLRKGLRVVYGDAEDSELWDRLPLKRLKGVVLTMPEFEVRSKTVKQLRHKGFSGQIGTICLHAEEKKSLVKNGCRFCYLSAI